MDHALVVSSFLSLSKTPSVLSAKYLRQAIRSHKIGSSVCALAAKGQRLTLAEPFGIDRGSVLNARARQDHEGSQLESPRMGFLGGTRRTARRPLEDPSPEGNGAQSGKVSLNPRCSAWLTTLPRSALAGISTAIPAPGLGVIAGGEVAHSAGELEVADQGDLGRQVEEQVGVGAFGSVWKARDLELDRTVAVKIPRKGQLDEDETEQFLREARSAAQLKHPGIVAVHEVGREDGQVYIVSCGCRSQRSSGRLSAARR